MSLSDFKPNPGRLATDRYDFESHILGNSFRHNSIQIDVNPPLVVDGYPYITVADALIALAGRVSGTGSSNVFVFRPGHAPSENVYNDFATLMTAADAVQGPKIIEFDDGYAPIHIPTGIWNWDDCTIKAKRISVNIIFDDGAVIIASNWTIKEFVILITQSTQPVWSPSGIAALFMYQGTINGTVSPSVPFIQPQNGSNFGILLYTSVLGEANYPVITVPSVGSVAVVLMAISTININLFSGSGGTVNIESDGTNFVPTPTDLGYPSANIIDTFIIRGDVTGASTTTVVGKLQGNAIDGTTLGATQDGYVLTWDNGSNEWRAKPNIVNRFVLTPPVSPDPINNPLNYVIAAIPFVTAGSGLFSINFQLNYTVSAADKLGMSAVLFSGITSVTGGTIQEGIFYAMGSPVVVTGGTPFGIASVAYAGPPVGSTGVDLTSITLTLSGFGQFPTGTNAIMLAMSGTQNYSGFTLSGGAIELP